MSTKNPALPETPPSLTAHPLLHNIKSYISCSLLTR